MTDYEALITPQVVLTALKAFDQSKPTEPLEALLIVRENLDKKPQVTPRTRSLAINDVLEKAIAELKTQQPIEAEILRLRFIEGLAIGEIIGGANKKIPGLLSPSLDIIRHRQRAAVAALTQIIHEMEREARSKHIAAIQTVLPDPSYRTLFGVDAEVELLTQRLKSTAAALVAVVTGIGGIGKTAVADKVARTLAGDLHYDKMVWLVHDPDQPERPSPESARSHFLNRLVEQVCAIPTPGMSDNARWQLLRDLLHTTRHLIVIDNLESEADATALVSICCEIAGASHFLLTSRAYPRTDPRVYQRHLTELSETAAVALIQEHATTLTPDSPAPLSDSDARDIYQAVGGNPLALKLVVGLTAVLPLQHVLHDLSQVQHSQVDALYRRIYWRVWRTLHENSRTLLLSMLTSAEEGMTIDHMVGASGLPLSELLNPITELATRSLIEVGGGADRRYAIHRLTRSFLSAHIAGLA